MGFFLVEEQNFQAMVRRTSVVLKKKMTVTFKVTVISTFIYFLFSTF